MRNFEITTDSTSDLFKDEIDALDVGVAHLEYTIAKGNEVELELDSYKCQEDYENFYNRLKNGYISKTSILNVQSHLNLFLEKAKNGVKNLLHISQGYGLSPTVDNANKAIEILKKDFPDINYVAIESNTTTYAEGFLVKCAVKLRDEGKTLDETVNKINELKHLIQHFILANDLKFLSRGGRISKTSANVGSLLQVKPIISFDKEGKLKIVRKEIGLNKAINSIVNDFSNFTLNKDFPLIAIVHTGNLPLAEKLQELFEQKYAIKPEIRFMGPIIGAHVGPSGVAYAFISNEFRPF